MAVVVFFLSVGNGIVKDVLEENFQHPMHGSDPHVDEPRDTSLIPPLCVRWNHV